MKKKLDSRTISHGPDPPDSNKQTVNPEDDGFHIVNCTIGDFEWWYFDILDHISDCFLKIVMHLGTDPLKTRIFPQLALSINTPEESESITLPYVTGQFQADTRQCNITIKDEIKIWTELDTPMEYYVKIDIPRFTCNFRFKGKIEGWKPLGNETSHQIGKKKGAFSWIIPMPKAKVEGEFFFDGMHYILHDAIGYHDHNYIRVDRKHPLHIDDLVVKWYWGKCYADRLTIVFMDTWLRTNRLLSLLVAEDNAIIHSANNRMNCTVEASGYDPVLQVQYPSSLLLQSTDEYFPFQTAFEFHKISDRKDLLEGVNPVLKYIIKKLISKPAYFGILAKVKVKIADETREGFGNFESMVFRGK
jgi:hypothetical protein